MFWLLFFIVAGIALAYAGAQVRTVTVVYAAVILFYGLFGHSLVTAIVLALAWAVLLIPMNLEALRQEWFTRPLFAALRRQMPALRGASRTALGANTGGWESELIGGHPDWHRLRTLTIPSLSDDERDFLGGAVETFCRLCDEWRITHIDHGLGDEAWTFLRRYGFLGMAIPRGHGGLEFSAMARSAVIAKIASSPGGITAAGIVNAANAGGLADLLMRHGTDAQKQFWLSRLANGEAVGCFALGAARAADDLSMLPDQGVVCEGEWHGTRTLGVRLSFDQRYVVLAPLATVIGIAFNLSDPERRLGDTVMPGLSCALVPRSLPGVEIGTRNFPLDHPLPIGPVRGRNVFIPIDFLVGGVAAAGKGWPMLQECVALSRSLALPSACAGTAVFTALMGGAYMRLRRPFGRPLSDSESVREMLARIGGRAYATDALRRSAAAAIDRGESSVAGAAMAKMQTSAFARDVVTDAMDLLAGKGVMLGPSNWLGRRWEGTPIAIGGDGANLTTRARLIFAPGLMRCHPYWLAEIDAARDENTARGLESFDALVWPHIGHVLGAAARALVLGLSGAMLAAVPAGPARRHRQRISRYSAALALTGDASLLQLGNRLRQRENLCARLTDVWSLLVTAASTIRKWEDEGRPGEDWPLVDWICTDAFERLEQALAGALRRVPLWPVRWLLRVLIFPLGRHARAPGDALTSTVAARLLESGGTRQRLRMLCFAPRTAGGPLSRIETALELSPLMEALEHRIVAAQQDGRLPAGTPRQIIDSAVAAEIINADDGHQLRQAYEEIDVLCSVDAFRAEQLRGVQT
jgi:acyl-CoA dehydrogenase